MSRGSTEAVKSDMNNNHNKPSQHLKISKELSRAFTSFHPEVPWDTGRAGSVVPILLTEDMEAQMWGPAYAPDPTRPGSLVWGSFYVGGKKEREKEKKKKPALWGRHGKGLGKASSECLLGE